MKTNSKPIQGDGNSDDFDLVCARTVAPSIPVPARDWEAHRRAIGTKFPLPITIKAPAPDLVLFALRANRTRPDAGDLVWVEGTSYLLLVGVLPSRGQAFSKKTPGPGSLSICESIAKGRLSENPTVYSTVYSTLCGTVYSTVYSNVCSAVYSNIYSIVYSTTNSTEHLRFPVSASRCWLANLETGNRRFFVFVQKGREFLFRGRAVALMLCQPEIQGQASRNRKSAISCF